MRYYFSFRTYFRMLRLARGETNPRGRRLLFFSLLVTVPLAASFHAVCFFLDGIFFPRLRRVDVRAPVFILGHARSGTTLLHRLMSRDAERFSFFLYYEMFFPSLLQKKLIRGLAALDLRLLGGAFGRRVQAWDERRFAATQHMHRMSLTAPEEDETVAYFSCDAGWWITRLPYMGLLDFYFVDERPPRRRRRLLRFYRDCVRRQLYLNGTDKVHLSKNPSFCGRVESLLEAFPDARFVIPFRDPNETIPSLLKLLQTGWAMRGWDRERMNESLRVLASQSYHTYRHPLQVLDRHPATRRAIVDYRALTARPRETILQVYAALDLPVSSEFDAFLQSTQGREAKHETRHQYSLEEFGLKGDEIRTELADLFQQFGWGEPVATTPESA